MGAVVDLGEWRRLARGDSPEVARLERVVQRLDALAAERLKSGANLTPGLETELLAILGALVVGSVDDAVARAERLASRLGNEGNARVR